jgi:hypothetical protein
MKLHPEWLTDEETRRFRKELQRQRGVRIEELMQKAMKSTDPAVAGAHARVSELDAVIRQLEGKGDNE